MNSGRFIADILTSLRIPCGLLMLFSPPFSRRFFIFYLLGGLTDAVDGTVARRYGSASPSGAVFDTAADIVFTAAALITILRGAVIPRRFVLPIVLIAAVKAAGILIGSVRYHRFVTIHSAPNRLTGAVLFILPLFLGSGCARQLREAALIAACIIAGAAAVLELIQICRGKTAQ